MMDIYTGIDVVENKRIKKAIDRFGDRFLGRIFQKNEVEYCSSLAGKIPCLAARFAVKEAFVKAFYQATGIILPYRAVEVRGKRGKPAEIFLHPPNDRVREALSRIRYTFSLSHEKSYSVAIVVIYTV